MMARLGDSNGAPRPNATNADTSGETGHRAAAVSGYRRSEAFEEAAARAHFSERKGLKNTYDDPDTCTSAILTLYTVIITDGGMAMHLANFAEGGQFEPRKIAAALRTSAEEIAVTVGLGKDALQRRTRINSDKTQRRLRELVEVLNKVEPRFGSELMAYAWYRSEPLPGFDGRTAMQLVRDGKAQQVLDYIDAVDAGVFA
ncbi:antitoxin Xre/MbcA/ParS toxin-binding domain-containing protein [Sagittula sp.]